MHFFWFPPETPCPCTHAQMPAKYSKCIFRKRCSECMRESDEERKRKGERGQKMETWKGTKWQAVWPLNLCTKKIKLTAHNAHNAHWPLNTLCTPHFRIKNVPSFRQRKTHPPRSVAAAAADPFPTPNSHTIIIILLLNSRILIFFAVSCMLRSKRIHRRHHRHAIDQFYVYENTNILILQTVAVTRVHKCTKCIQNILDDGRRASVVRSNQLIG